MKNIQYFFLTKSIGLYLNLLSFINIKKATYAAYLLFSQPRKGKIEKTNVPKTLQTSLTEQFVFQNEQFTIYKWEGDATIIFLVHGWESNASRWKKLLHQLKPLGHTIIAIDAPAHGYSTGTEFNALKYAEYINVVQEKYPSNTIIGHSVGGAAIVYYLSKYKNNSIEKVVLLGAPSDFQIISNDFVKLLSLNGKIKHHLEKYYEDKFHTTIEDLIMHKKTNLLPQKALIAHDIEDTVVKVEEGRKYASHWNDSKYIETKGLGHSMHDTVLYQQIIDFIKE